MYISAPDAQIQCVLELKAQWSQADHIT